MLFFEREILTGYLGFQFSPFISDCIEQEPPTDGRGISSIFPVHSANFGGKVKDQGVFSLSFLLADSLDLTSES